MSLKVLLASPDKEWIAGARQVLEDKMFEVETASKGKEAQLLLYSKKQSDAYFAAIIHNDLKDHSGVQVIRYIKKNYPNLFIIVLLDQEDEIINESYYIKLAIHSILRPPFDVKVIADLLESGQSVSDMMKALPKKEGTSNEEEVSLNDNKFSQVKIDELYTTRAILFDVFIRLSENKYIKILHRGDSFSNERIEHYKKNKNIQHLYFLNSDRRKYLKFLNSMAKKAVETTKLSTNSKVRMLTNLSAKILEEVSTEGMRPQVIEQGKEICENICTFIEKQDDLYKLLVEFDSFDPKNLSHAFSVTLFATSLIKQFEWQSTSTLKTAALACLFHDIGKIKLPVDLQQKRPEQMNEEELKEYKKHSEHGVLLLEGKPAINNSVKQMILQHHEYCNGSGFPFGIKGSSISVMSNILCLANDFVHLLIDQNLKPSKALKHILASKDLFSKYHPLVLENFIKTFVDPKKIAKKYFLPSNSKIVDTKKGPEEK